MPLRTIKKDTAQALTLEWVLHVRNYRLDLDKDRCTGCEICSLACPKEAISITRQARTGNERAQKAKIDINLAKCNFCGICDLLCPYGAIRVTLDGQHNLPVIEKESFPQLIRDIRVDASKCPVDCEECGDSCPLDLIKVTHSEPHEKQTEDTSSLGDQKKKESVTKVDVQEERCPCCRICEIKCPEGVMHVRRLFHGTIAIHPEKCPEDCKNCLDVCPITGALYFSDDDRKIHVDEEFCVYCGACKTVCPKEDALELKRTSISHTPIHSGAWNKALERLTSPSDLAKELKTKGSLRARESARKRVGLKVEANA